MQVQRQPRRRSIAYQPDLGCSVSFRVRYYETDAMGVVHHSNYLRWFEIGRTEYLRVAGMTYRSMEERGLGCPLTGSRTTYHRFCRYDDLVTVQTWITAYNGVRLAMAYCVWVDGDLVCEGETHHAFLANGRPVAVGRSLPDIHEGMLACLQRDQLVLQNGSSPASAPAEF